MPSHFDHVTLIVGELDSATRAYERLLGAGPSWRGTHPELGTAATLFGLGNAFIELVAPSPDDERSDGMRALVAERGEGLHALALGSDDVDALRATWRGRGLRVAPPEAGEALGQDGRVRSYRSMEVSPRQTRGISVLAVERRDGDRLGAVLSPGPAVVEALDHVVLRTSDPDAAVATYGEGLGIRLALDRRMGGIRMLFFRVGGVTLEVIEDAQLGAQDSFWGMALRVRDLESAHTRMSGAGLDLGDIRSGNKPGTEVYTVRGGTCGVPTLVIRDPSRD